MMPTKAVEKAVAVSVAPRVPAPKSPAPMPMPMGPLAATAKRVRAEATTSRCGTDEKVRLSFSLRQVRVH